jgi:hypothetical protein
MPMSTKCQNILATIFFVRQCTVRAKNSGRQCHFKIWLDYAHVNKVSKKFELLLKK